MYSKIYLNQIKFTKTSILGFLLFTHVFGLFSFTELLKLITLRTEKMFPWKLKVNIWVHLNLIYPE